MSEKALREAAEKAISISCGNMACCIARAELRAALQSQPEQAAADVESLAAKFHEIYQLEAKRQGDVRHKDAYADLPENIKEFDRVLARYVLSTWVAGQASQPTQRESGLARVLEQEVIALNREISDWRHEFNLWRGAWLRHLGGYIVSKAHEIDGFGLRHEQQLREEYERGAGDGLNALMYRDRYIEEVSKALGQPSSEPGKEAGE